MPTPTEVARTIQDKAQRQAGRQADQDANRKVDPEVVLTPAQLRQVIWQASWMTLVLAPLLYWIHGPSVSQDQWIVRVLLICLAVVGAAHSLLTFWLNRSRPA